ncbi:MAG: hypothetical protein ACFFFH_13530 [Candidatus Thorarchaeota archaeon]
MIRLGYVTLVLLAWMSSDIETGYIPIAMTNPLTTIILLVLIVLTEDVSWNNLW